MSKNTINIFQAHNYLCYQVKCVTRNINEYRVKNISGSVHDPCCRRIDKIQGTQHIPHFCQVFICVCFKLITSIILIKQSCCIVRANRQPFDGKSNELVFGKSEVRWRSGSVGHQSERSWV